MKPFLERILNYYHLSYEEYQKLTAPVSRDNFDAGHKFDHMDEVVDFIKQYLPEDKKIIIYGDYDCDGIMATSIMVKMFTYLGKEVDYYIPNRYVDGYGINLIKAQEIIDNHYDLVITVDNGISAFEPIKLLKDNNIAVCVFDHHEMQNELPVCDYYLHPILSHFGDIAASGGFVSFMFSKAFLGRYDKYLATLASISLISDMMPLREYNRNLLRNVIQEYTPGEFYALDLLIENGEFDETAIGMRIGPKINSIGRLVDNPSVNDIVDYLVSEDKEQILNYFEWITNLNEERKGISKSAIGENLQIDENAPCYCLKVNEKEGVIGLIANHVVTKHKKPAIIFAPATEDGCLKGSCRTPEGYNVVKLFESLKDLLITFGGHAFAGGCSIKEENFDAFKEAFENYVASNEAVITEKEYIPLFIKELTFENLDIVRSFSPFGETMKSPLFVLPRIRTASLMYSKSGDHIMTQIGTNTRLVGFNFPRSEVGQNAYIDLIGFMRKNEYRGFVNLEFFITEIKISE